MAISVLRDEPKSVEFDPLFAEYFSQVSSWAGKRVTLQTVLRVSTALACARVIAEGIAMLPFKLLQQEGRDIKPGLAHPLYDLLAVSPNELQTSFEFFESMGLHLVLCGNAYVLVNRVGGKIREMYLLEPGWVSVKYRWPNLPDYTVTTPDGRTFDSGSGDIWHVRGPAWCTSRGLDFVDLAREALGLSMAIEEGQAKMQAQGVRIPGFLAVDGKLTEDQHDKLTKWIAKHEGSANAGRSLIVDNAAKWVSQSMSNVDAQMVEMRKFQIEEVCRFFRVMPIMVGFSDKAQTYASAESMFLAHVVHTLGSWLRRIEQSADKNCLTANERKAGFYTKFNEKALQRMTAKDQMDYLARGTLSGIIVRNEAREKLDLNPLPGLDDPLAPANTFLNNPPSAPDNSSGTSPDNTGNASGG